MITSRPSQALCAQTERAPRSDVNKSAQFTSHPMLLHAAKAGISTTRYLNPLRI